MDTDVDKIEFLIQNLQTYSANRSEKKVNYKN